MKIRIKHGKTEIGTTPMKAYVVLKIGNNGFWFLNNLDEKEYAEFKDCEQLLENGKWEGITNV